jgi:hypothetical protein
VVVIAMVVTAVVVIGSKCYTGFVIELLAQIGKGEKLRANFAKDGS